LSFITFFWKVMKNKNNPAWPAEAIQAKAAKSCQIKKIKTESIQFISSVTSQVR